MVDVKLQNGDVALDSTGSAVRLSDRDARFQRALVRLTVPLGSFVYDRSLGTRRSGTDGPRTELLFCEALACCPDTQVRVLSVTDTCAAVRLTIGGESRTEEVRAYGNVS